MELNYEADIKIDDQILDVEWLEQPEKMFRYCAALAKAKMNLDFAKEALDVIKAELDGDVRTNPGNYGVDKITDKVVENVIPKQEAYKKANSAYIQAKYETEMIAAAVRAIDQRKDALENLVKLHGQSYFAGPKIPHNIGRVRSEKGGEAILTRTK